MTNLDSSWQASVMKLAQTGNSRAIAFWMNRYLVPQGMCAQVETELSGCIVIRVVCHQMPDADQLVRFICHRLYKLESNKIEQVRIIAQVVGSPQVLWEKSARIPSPSARPDQQSVARPRQPSPQPTPESSVMVAAVAPTVISWSDLPQAKPAEKSQLQKFRLPLSNLKNSFSHFLSGQPLSALTNSTKSPKLQPPFKNMQTAALDLTDRSLHWLARQKPTTRMLLLGGSAVTAFLIGCSFELAGHAPGSAPTSESALMKLLRSTAALSGSVKASSERIAVIQQPVPNPDDPVISLIFSNSATLTRLSASQRNQITSQQSANQASVGSANRNGAPVITSIENYRLADMMVTNLTEPLSSTLSPDAADSRPAASSSAKTAAPAATPQAETGATAEGMVLKQLPFISGDSHLSDSETERAKYAIGNEAAASAESKSSSDGEIKPKTNPFWTQELLANRVDLVNLASDTLMAKGADQLNQTLALLKQDGIHTTGSGQTSTEARRPQIFNVKGKRIAYLGYSDSSTHAANASMAGINVGVSKQLQEDIKAIRDQVDWIVINLSWNRELRAYPENWQISLAHAAIDYGADLVVGYDANVTQGAEIYNGRPIVYSLGSSIDEYRNKPGDNYDMAALKVTLKDHVMELEFLPIQVKQGLAAVAKGEPGTKIFKYIEQASSVFDHPLHSPATINSQLRLSLPGAPDSTTPTNPFISYPTSNPASHP